MHGNGDMNVTRYCLNGTPEYFFKVDAINDAGAAPGTEVTPAAGQ